MDDLELLRLDILARISAAKAAGEWERFRVDCALLKLHFPDEVKKLCDHLSGDALNQCLDIIRDIEDTQV